MSETLVCEATICLLSRSVSLNGLIARLAKFRAEEAAGCGSNDPTPLRHITQQYSNVAY